MRGVKKRLFYHGVDANTIILEGKIADTLVDYADNNAFDLIVMATHGRSGLARWVIGSIADKIMHYSTVPVLLVRSEKQE